MGKFVKKIKQPALIIATRRGFCLKKINDPGLIIGTKEYHPYKQSNIGGPDRSENDASPCKLMNNHGGNTFLYCSCQQLSHLGLGPSKSI